MFGDVQRCKPSTVQEHNGLIRGICWRTKVCSNGQPWGCVTEGATGFWGSIWSKVLSQWAEKTDAEPDYRLPNIFTNRGTTETILLDRPMPYTRYVGWLRWLLTRVPDDGMRMTGTEAIGITAHSLKSTLLSWSNQLNILEDLRMLQGHHRVTGGRTSAQLYSRDDVYGALRLQDKVWQHNVSGYRPISPQARGGQQPVMDIPIPRGWLATRRNHDWLQTEDKDETRLNPNKHPEDELDNRDDVASSQGGNLLRLRSRLYHRLQGKEEE